MGNDMINEDDRTALELLQAGEIDSFEYYSRLLALFACYPKCFPSILSDKETDTKVGYALKQKAKEYLLETDN